MDLIFDLAKKKPWIREECGWVVYRSVYDLSAGKADDKYIEVILERMSSNDLARTPEGVSIWVATRDMFPNAKLPPKIWKYDDPLDSRERGILPKIMKESSTAEPEEGNKGNTQKPSGVWNPKLHFAWDAVLARVSDDNKKQKPKDKTSKSSRLSFVDFWTELVDSKWKAIYILPFRLMILTETIFVDGLFSASSSEERKYWGFLLFVKVINGAPLQQASHVFTKNFVRCLMNQLAVEDRYLHRMASKAVKSLHARVSEEPFFAAAAVNGLMGPAGSVNFDQVTKTKTVEKIVTEANADALNEIVTLFEKLIENPGTTDNKAASTTRQLLAGYLLSIVRAGASAKSESEDSMRNIFERILLVLVRFAYFKEKDDQSGDQSVVQPAVTEATQELFRSRINSCLNSIIANQKYATTVPYTIVQKIRDATKSEEYGKCIIEMDETIRNSVKIAFKSLKKLSSKVRELS